MLKLLKMSEEEKVKFNLINKNECYILKKEDKILGFIIMDDLYIYILESERYNGYGTTLFKYLLKKLKEKNIKDFETLIPINNIIMRRIIENNKGIEVSRKESIVKYICYIE